MLTRTTGTPFTLTVPCPACTIAGATDPSCPRCDGSAVIVAAALTDAERADLAVYFVGNEDLALSTYGAALAVAPARAAVTDLRDRAHAALAAVGLRPAWVTAPADVLVAAWDGETDARMAAVVLRGLPGVAGVETARTASWPEDECRETRARLK